MKQIDSYKLFNPSNINKDCKSQNQKTYFFYFDLM